MLYGSNQLAIHPLNGDLYSVNSTLFNQTPTKRAHIIRLAQDLKSFVSDVALVGGSKSDSGDAIAINPVNGEVYIGGVTDFNDYPNTAGGFQPNNDSTPASGIHPDIYIRRLSADLKTTIQATYLGGTALESISQLLVDQQGAGLYISGVTFSTNFPSLTVTNASSGIPFIANMSSDLKNLLQVSQRLSWGAEIVQHPITREIFVNNYGTPHISQEIIQRFSNDLKKNYLIQLDTYPLGNGSGEIFSPLTGDLYILSDDFTLLGQSSTESYGITTPGSYQPVSNIKTGGLSDLYIAHFTYSDMGSNPSQECLFNWAEKNYPTLLAPAGAVTNLYDPYFYRYYPATNAYVGVSQNDQHVYYLGPNGVLQDMGALSGWLTTAGCNS